jgi:hypothetical protein
VDIFENLVVVSPGWVGDVDGSRAVDFAVKLGEEGTSEMNSTST